MPILRRSIATSQTPPEPINADAEVFCCLRTGEFFATYAEYVERVSLYSKPVWTCRLTGHTGMTYSQARASELAAQKVLEGFNEWWKPYCLTSIHFSTESIDSLAGRMANYLKTHLVLNEPVKMPFDDTLYDGIISMAPPFPESAETEAAPSPPATYRISINQDDLIMDGACRGPEDVMRQYNPPSRNLLKKFIRSVAVRYGHTGMPWIVREDLLTRYHVQKRIDPEMAERIKSVLSQRKRKEQNIIVGLPAIRKEPSSSTDKQSGPEEVIKYPILDEFLPPDKQSDPNNWPSPKPFNPDESIVAQGLFAELLELWHFIHSFSSSIQITPMSLHCLLESLEYCKDPNPIFESLCTSFSTQLDRNLRTAKLCEERIEQYVGNATIADLPPFYMGPPQLGEENEEADQELENHLATTTKSRKDSVHWSSRIIELLFEVRKIPDARSILEVMMRTQQRFYELPGYLKLQCLLILRNLYVTCVSLRPVVDREVETVADAKHRIRELESERRKVVKEGQDMMNEHDELSRKLESEEHSIEELRALKKVVRSLDIRISKSSKTEERLSHEIMTTKNKRYEHSACRILPLGEDRLLRRYWWMDMHLIKPSARTHSTGLILVETPPPVGVKHNLPSSWSYYDREEEVESLISFLNPLGCREARLGAVLTQHREAITKSLAPFPLAKVENEEIPTDSPDKQQQRQRQETQEDSSEEEEMPVVMQRRSVKRRAPAIDVEPVAEFLRYRNTFRSAQGKRAFVSSR